MERTAVMANQWIPSKVFLDQELPVMLDAPFASVKQDTYYTKDLTGGSLRDKNESRDIGTIDSQANDARVVVRETSSLISPMRINQCVRVDVIDVRNEESKAEKHVLIYEEQRTKFVVLKALKSIDPSEVANELVEIMTTIGAPRIIESGNGRDYADKIVREIRQLLRGFFLVADNAMLSDVDRRDFRKIIESWMKKNPERLLTDALRVIQVTENTTENLRNGRIPSQFYFGENICEDLRRTIGSQESDENFFSNKATESTKQHNSFIDDERKSYRKFEIHDVSARSNPVSCEIPSDAKQTRMLQETTENLNSDPEKRVSDEEKYFSCKICEKRYAKLTNLRNHVKTHGKNGQIECPVCRKSFRSSSLFEEHAKRLHGKETSESGKTESNENEEAKESPKNSEKTDCLVDEESGIIPSQEKTASQISLRSFGRKTFKDSKFRGKHTLRGSMKNSSQLLECKYCEQKFSFPSVLKRHLRSHTNERPYVCQLCNKSFKQLGHLSQHSVTHTDYRSFQCTICSMKFNGLEALKLHSSSHAEETIIRSREAYRLIECDVCKKVFTTKSVLERHIITHTHERKFACKICGKRFKQAGHVKSHMLVHTGERKFACTLCTKRFSLSNSLKKHMYVHNGEKPYQCDVCGARFLEKRNLNGHLMTHTNERPFSCKICGKRYTLADTLRRHVSAAHEDGRTYQCEICAKMFKQLAHLSVHKKVHNDERPFQCHLCEKNFKHKNVLKSHLAIHANLRPFECDICKATFVRKTTLKTHIASAHMNERPYACTICNKRFKQISHLNGHIVVHSNSMPYQCEFCDRRCNRLDNLKKHMRLHTKNKD